MKHVMKDIDTIFSELGGTGKVADFLDVKPSAASEMRRRKSIPVKYWPKLVSACAANGVYGVSYDALVSMHSEAA
jgi:hypothetical protein